MSRHSTWPEGVLRYVYLDAAFTPELVSPAVIGSTADMASPLSLQHANAVCYVVSTYLVYFKVFTIIGV
jgi:hypothetical protein